MEKGLFDFLQSLNDGLSGAVAQGAYIFFGITFLGFGLVLAIGWLRLRSGTVEVDGTVKGMRRHGKFLYAIYSYHFADSNDQEAMSDTGTTDARVIETGRQVKLLVSRSTPGTAHEQGGMPWHMFGFAAVAIGLFLLFRAYTDYEVNGLSWAVTFFLVLYSYSKYRSVFGTGRQRKTIAQWRQMQWENLADSPAGKVEDLRADPAAAQRMETAQQLAGIIGAVLAAAGAGMLAYGVYIALQPLALMTDGVHARGKVTELSREYTSGKISGYLYFPVVHFKDGGGREFSFEDHIGAGAPAYDEGEEVGVVYLAKDPQNTATIDHGANGWFMPAISVALGLLFLLKGISMMPRRRDEVR